jgi:hypothetical protein
MRIGNSRFILRYRGHEKRFISRGPNWWQITVPWLRVAYIRWWPTQRY